MPRLLLLLTGGTLLMTPQADGKLTLDEEKTSRDLLAEVPTLGRIADFETRLLFQMDSANMQPADWVTLAREVHGALAEYDGVVVVHGTDTMAYSASALAMLLGPVPKPVVLTGAQRPLSEVRTDARENLTDAALVATLAVPEVAIVMGSRALRGARATKRDAWGLDAFDSPNCPPLVELGVGVEIASHVRAPTPLADFDARLEPRVLAVRVFPGLDPELVRGAIRAGVRGLVLEAYGTGNLPLLAGSLIPALDEARARDVPVLVVSQCFRGHVDLGQYEGGAEAEAAGAMGGGDMTVEAALAKMMVGLARFGAGQQLRAWLAASVVGERD
ncbi:MAG TPA: asparaginase [Labilithrix sp.]